MNVKNIKRLTPYSFYVIILVVPLGKQNNLSGSAAPGTSALQFMLQKFHHATLPFGSVSQREAGGSGTGFFPGKD